MLQNVKHLSEAVLEKKNFEYISMHFYASNLGPPDVRPSGSWDLALNKLVKDHRAMLHTNIPNFKHLSKAVLEKKIFKYISFLNQRLPAAGPFWTPGPPFEQTW